MPAILFVCTANLCRSPVAQQLFTRIIQQADPQHGWQIESAGVWAVKGRASPARLIKAAIERGLDLRSHRSQSVEHVDLTAFDLILTMEASQCEALRAEFPAFAARIQQLSALAGPRYDIADPYGGSEEDYHSTIFELDRLIKKALPRIVEMAEKVHEEKTQAVALAAPPALGTDDSRLGHSSRTDSTHRPILTPCLSGG